MMKNSTIAMVLLIFIFSIVLNGFLNTLSVLESINNQITEIRSQPQTYCIKYKPMGE